jgi:hypothetical protein
MGEVGVLEHFDEQGMARGLVRSVFIPAVATRAGRETDDQVNLGQKFQIVAGPHGARLHEILMGVGGEAGAHKDVENVMHQGLGLGQR